MIHLCNDVAHEINQHDVAMAEPMEQGALALRFSTGRHPHSALWDILHEAWWQHYISCMAMYPSGSQT